LELISKAHKSKGLASQDRDWASFAHPLHFWRTGLSFLSFFHLTSHPYSRRVQ